MDDTTIITTEQNDHPSREGSQMWFQAPHVADLEI